MEIATFMEQRAEEVHSFTLSGVFSSNLSCFSQQPPFPLPFFPSHTGEFALIFGWFS